MFLKRHVIDQREGKCI